MRWLLGERNRHIRPQTISEYIDGRLSPRNAARVEEHLAGCARCRDEVESLRRTVALLRRVPQREPSRSFTILEMPVPARSAFRVPVWAYGAVASAFALAFAVILSVDLVGVLAPSPSPEQQGLKAAAVVTPVPQVPEGERTFEAAPAPSPSQDSRMAQTAPQVTPTPAPPPKAEELLPPTPAPSVPIQPGATPWIWHLVEGLLAALALATVVGTFLLRRRAGSFPR